MMNRTELNAVLRRIVEKYADVARGVLEENLLSVALFGSVARGEAGPHSDIDLLIVCRELPKGMFKRHRLLEPVREELREDLERLWKEGIWADFTELVYTEKEAGRFRWVYLDMVEDAIILFDKDGFLKGILDSLRKRLKELGAQRRRMGRVRYWDLKPDLKPGEVVEL